MPGVIALVFGGKTRATMSSTLTVGWQGARWVPALSKGFLELRKCSFDRIPLQGNNGA